MDETIFVGPGMNRVTIGGFALAFAVDLTCQPASGSRLGPPSAPLPEPDQDASIDVASMILPAPQS